MSRYQFTPQASDGLIDICNVIAQDNPEAAGCVEAAVFQACDFLAHSPRAGKVRKDVASLPLRFRAVHPYSITWLFTIQIASRCALFEFSKVAISLQSLGRV
jgi:plasmid stabilization system protein ParE